MANKPFKAVENVQGRSNMPQAFPGRPRMQEPMAQPGGNEGVGGLFKRFGPGR